MREAELNLRDGGALRAAVQAALERLARERAGDAGQARAALRGEVELVVWIDASGAVVRVEVVKSSGREARTRLEQALLGLRSAARPASPGPASYRLVCVVGPATQGPTALPLRYRTSIRLSRGAHS